MRNLFWLQLFAEDAAASEGGGEVGAAGVTGQDAAVQTEPGVTAADAAQQAEQETMAERLKKLGVPEEKLQRRAYQRKTAEQAKPAAESAEGQDAAAEPEENQTNEPKPLTFQEMLKSNPDYDREMQNIIRNRVRAADGAKSALKALEPMLSKLARQYGVQPGEDGTLDYGALSDAVLDDDWLYEDRASELGVSTEIAKKLDQAEQLQLEMAAQARTQEEQRQLAEHWQHLQEQVPAMQQKFPNFDLNAELENERFLRMTSPSGGMSLEEAYFAVHRQEILQSMQNQARQQAANAIQANRNRPNEGGAKGGSVAQGVQMDWHHATKEQREQLKARIRSGERVLPGQYG